MNIKRGNIVRLLFDDSKGSEQSNERIALIIQNDKGNKFSPTTIVSAITSQQNKANLPTHIAIKPTKENGLIKNSVVLLEQIRTFDIDERFDTIIGSLDKHDMNKVDNALAISVGLNKNVHN